MNIKPLVSIIIPVYNASCTVHLTIDKLCKQTYTRLELVFINDCSQDDSVLLIESSLPFFAKKGILARIVSHGVNKGVAAARNTGLEHATGDFIYYVDADDYIEPDAIDLLVNKAVSENADIIGCNWFLTFEKNERKMNQPVFNSPWDAIHKILNGSMRWNLWLFMARRALYEDNNVRFISGKNMGEDLMVMIKLFLNASKVVYLDKALYHYGQANEQSLTKTYSDAHIREVTVNVAEVEECLLKSDFADRLGKNLDYLKLNIKLPLLISDQEIQYEQWLNWFPEANDKVMANTALPLRTRLLQWLAVKRQFWAIKVYYRTLIRVVYGKLYK